MNLPILEVAIGLALVYLMLAILCSGLMETISGFWNMRGEMLWRGIESLLGGEGASGGPLRRLSSLRSAARGHIVPDAPPPGSRNNVLVRDLSAELLNHPLIEALRNGARAPSYLEANRFSTAFVDTLAKTYGGGANLYHDFASIVESLPPGSLRDQLELVIREAGTDADKVKQGVERMFDETMDRVSGWYKRQTQWLLLAVAFVTAVSMNVDSIELTRKLWREPELRALAAKTSEEFIADYDALTDKERAEAAERALTGMDLARLPMGWPPSWASKTGLDFWCSLALALLGWIVTALAVSLGAPYWYDLLSRLLPLRAAGKKAATDTPAPPPAAGPPAVAPAPAADVGPVKAAPAAAPEPFLDALNDYEATTLTEGDVREIQTLLGVPDTGRLDQTTREAIAREQARTHFPETGELNSGFVRHLLHASRA